MIFNYKCKISLILKSRACKQHIKTIRWRYFCSTLIPMLILLSDASSAIPSGKLLRREPKLCNFSHFNSNSTNMCGHDAMCYMEHWSKSFQRINRGRFQELTESLILAFRLLSFCVYVHCYNSLTKAHRTKTVTEHTHTVLIGDAHESLIGTP